MLRSSRDWSQRDGKLGKRKHFIVTYMNKLPSHETGSSLVLRQGLMKKFPVRLFRFEMMHGRTLHRFHCF